MKIKNILCTPFTIPLKTVFHSAAATLAESEYVLFEVQTDDGPVGVAEAPSRPYLYGESQRSMVASVDRWFREALAGHDPFNVEGAWHKFDAIAGNLTVKGALDMAMHDIIGQAVGQPCAKLLGGYAGAGRVSFACFGESPEAIAAEARAMQESRGIDAFKLKIGLSPKQDLTLMKTVRDALPDALLYADVNGAYGWSEALYVLAAAADHGFAWVEEPCAVDDRRGRARVAQDSPIPILGDDSVCTLADAAREFRDGTIDLVSIKVARTGFRVSARIAAAALAARAKAMVGTQMDTGIGTLCSLHFHAAHAMTNSLPGELSFFLSLREDVLAEPLSIVDGLLQIPDSPGLGVRIDRDKLRHFTVD